MHPGNPSPRPSGRPDKSARWWTALLVPLVVGGAVFSGLQYRSTLRRRAAAPPIRQADVPPVPTNRPLDGRLRIGLVSQSGGAALTLKLLSAGGRVESGTGRIATSVPVGVPLSVTADFAAGQVRIDGPGVRMAGAQLTLAANKLRLGKRIYPDALEFRLAGTGLQVVNALEIEQYLQGVLPGELPRHFGPEAQKALAVAARSYALVQRGKHGDFDLCDQTCCQMYLGQVPGAVRGLAAVRATRHLCLWDGDKPAYTFYEADCGGLSTNVDDVPLKDKPAGSLSYLRMVRDAPGGGEDYCASSPFHRWTKRLTKEKLEERLNRRPETYVGKLEEVRITEFDPSGRVKEVELRGAEPAPTTSATALFGVPPPAPGPIEKTVSGWEFRRSVGALTLKSTRLTMDEPEPGQYRFTGTGFGHGLGLCQIGANGMAARGRTFRQILAHYYPGTEVRALPRG